MRSHAEPPRYDMYMRGSLKFIDGLNSNHEKVLKIFTLAKQAPPKSSLRLDTPQTSQISRIYFQLHLPRMNTESGLREFALALAEERNQCNFLVSQQRILYSNILKVLVTFIYFDSVIVKEVVAALFLLGVLL